MKPTYEELEQRIRELEEDRDQEQQLDKGARRQESLAQKYFDLTSTIIVSLDRALAVSFINRKGCELLGYPAEEILGKNWFEHFLPARLRQDVQAVARVLFAGNAEPVSSFENHVLCRDGSERLIAWQNSYIRDEEGKVVEVISSGEDISDREAVLQELQEAYKIINRSSSVAFLWENAEGWPVKFVSENVEQLTGYTSADFMTGAVSYAEIIDPDDLGRVGQEVEQASNDHRHDDFQHEPYRIITKDSKLKWVADSTHIKRDDQGVPTHYQGIVTDISVSKELEQERLALTRQMEQVQRYKSLNVMAGAVAHHFNNIMMGVLGNLELLQFDLPADSRTRKLAAAAEKSALRACHISSSMLTYVGQLQVHKEAADFNALILEIKGALESSVEGDIDIQLHFDCKPVVSLVDSGQFKQVILALVLNAGEAIGEGPGQLTITTGYGWEEMDTLPTPFIDCNLAPGQYAFCEIADNGCGMDTETIARMFEPFFTSKFTGRGLGLAVVAGIVKSHGGALLVTSSPGVGSKIRLVLPAHAADVTVLPVDDISVGEETLPRLSGLVLLADDDPQVRTVGIKMLELLGFEVVYGRDGQEAVELYKQHHEKLVLVILNVSMPERDGIAALQEIKAINDEARVIFATGFTEEHIPLRGQDRRPEAFIQKPYSLQNLASTIKKVLGS